MVSNGWDMAIYQDKTVQPKIKKNVERDDCNDKDKCYKPVYPVNACQPSQPLSTPPNLC